MSPTRPSPTRFLPILLLGFLPLIPARAADRFLGADGTLHTLIAENRPANVPGGGGTRLVHQLQKPDGTVESRILPGTDDPPSDLDPAIAVSPTTGLPVAVWSRQTTSDYEIQIAFFTSGRWSSPRTVTANGWNDRSPQIVIGRSGLIHLIWSAAIQTDASPAVFESIFDSKGTLLVQPIEILLPPGTPVSDAGSPPPNMNPDDVLFAVDSSAKTGSRRVTVYGGYDEPVPVPRRVDFVLPSGTASIDYAKVEGLGARVVLYVRAGSRVYYSVESPAGWTPFRLVNLDSIPQERAEVLIEEMVLRSQEP